MVPFLSHFYVTLRCIVPLLCFMSNDIKCQLVLINKLKHKYINTPKYNINEWMNESLIHQTSNIYWFLLFVWLCQLLHNLSCENYFLKWKKQQIILAPKNNAKKKNMKRLKAKRKKETRRQFFIVSLDFRKRRFYLLKNTPEIFEEMDNVSWSLWSRVHSEVYKSALV